MKPLVGIIFIFFISFQAFSQMGRVIDSLESSLKTEHDIHNRIELYIALSDAYQEIDIDKSKLITNQALTLARNIEDNKSMGILHRNLGDFAMKLDDIDRAEEEYLLAIGFLEGSGANDILIHAHLLLGNRYNEKDNYPQAMNHYLKGIRLSEAETNVKYLPQLYNNLGVVYLKLNKPEQALELYSQAMDLFTALGDTINIAGTTTNIGSIFIELGDMEIAKEYYLNGLEIFENINHRAGQAHALFKLGLLEEMQDNYQSALDYLLKSLTIQQVIEVNPTGSKKMFLADTYVNLGIVYFSLKENELGEYYLKMGHDLAVQTQQHSLITLSSERLSNFYKRKQMFDKALDYYVVFKQNSDSLFNEDNVKKLTQLEMQHQYESRLRDAELNQLVADQKRKRLNLIYFVLSIGLLLILIIVLLLLRLEKNKKKKVEIEKNRLTEKLDHTNKELTTYVMYLLRKNEFILSIIEKLKKARLDAKPENKIIIAELISELKSNTESLSWEEFELRFQEVHTDFYDRLRQKFPDLSANEIRLCAFFRLNMTTKEIAAITYQSLNSIKVARYRLRKKLQLPQDENLIKFFSQL